MKKIVLTLILPFILQVAFAQKPDAEMRLELEKAIEDTRAPGKADKAATWEALGSTYMRAYLNPIADVAPERWDIWKDTFREKPISQQFASLNGKTFRKVSYTHFDAYFNEEGKWEFADITQPSVPGDLLGEAAKAFSKAYALGAKEEDMTRKLQIIVDKYAKEAYIAHSLGDLQRAGNCFAGAYNASILPPCKEAALDCAYNAALTAKSREDYVSALKYLQICRDADYGGDGEIYALLSDIYGRLGDTARQKEVLEQGYAKYPQCQGVLIGLLNFGEEHDGDPGELLSLLDKALKNDPGNTTALHIFKGNVLARLKDYDKADETFRLACEQDPSYHYGLYAWGKMWFDRAVEYQSAANALPDNATQQEYDSLMDLRDKTVAKCIAPLEQCFNTTDNTSYKTSCAGLLYKTYRILSEENNDYKAKADFYKNYRED